MLPLFDSHAHLQSSKFAADLGEALTRAELAGVRRVLNLGTKLSDARAVVELARRSPLCLAAVGVHPSDYATWSPEVEAGLREIADDPNVVVWGEIGVDYYWPVEDAERMRTVFRRQLAVARELGLPVAIHSRGEGCTADILRILREERGAEIGGVMHCFGGTEDEARAFVDLGFALGVGGIATYPKNEDARAVLRAVGVEHLLLETDAPYLSPQPQRGKRNEPAFLVHTARAVAKALEIGVEDLLRRAWDNTVRAFRLTQPAHTLRGVWAQGTEQLCVTFDGGTEGVLDRILALQQESGAGEVRFPAHGRALRHVEALIALGRELRLRGLSVVVETDGQDGAEQPWERLKDAVDAFRVPFTGPDQGVYNAVHQPADLQGAFETAIRFLDGACASGIPVILEATPLEGVDLAPVREMAVRIGARLELQPVEPLALARA